MKKIVLITVSLVSAILSVFSVSAQTYFVKKVSPGAVRVTGKHNDRAWRQANLLTHFLYPWDTVPAPATAFAALWDGEWLYCRFLVKDDTVLIYKKVNAKKEVGASDRAEIFLSTDDTLSRYYCLELDASGRILDYTATYYRNMDYDWQWPKGQLVVKTSPTADGYIVEAAISIQSLKELGLLKEGHLRAGLFRAECKSLRDGRADLRWISWIAPPSVKPDFHIPSAFGMLVLEGY